MPAKVKVRILAGRNLPVMDKSSDASDAFVEVKLGNTTYKTEVYRRSLNPFWNSEWFRFEVSDQELQDEPLQIRIMDYDTYSANDAIGKVYINLNPLLVNPGRSMSGWLPIYDTLHGIRGEINCMVKVNLFADNNRYRHSSCGVRFFFSDIPNGYKCEAILGFVDELLVNDDPEYQWIDKIRTPRASNEARQTLFTKLSGEVQRKLGLKAEIFGGNAVIGYQQSFDLEGGSGIVGRGIGTAVVLSKIGFPYEGIISPLHMNNQHAPYPYCANSRLVNNNQNVHDRSSRKSLTIYKTANVDRPLVHSVSADYFYEVPVATGSSRKSFFPLGTSESSPKGPSFASEKLDDSEFVDCEETLDNVSDSDYDEPSAKDHLSSISSVNQNSLQKRLPSLKSLNLICSTASDAKESRKLANLRRLSQNSLISKLRQSNENISQKIAKVAKPLITETNGLTKLLLFRTRPHSWQQQQQHQLPSGSNSANNNSQQPLEVQGSNLDVMGQQDMDGEQRVILLAGKKSTSLESSTGPSTLLQSQKSTTTPSGSTNSQPTQQQLLQATSSGAASIKRRRDKSQSTSVDDALSIIEEKFDDDGDQLHNQSLSVSQPRARLLSGSSSKGIRQMIRDKEIDLNDDDAHKDFAPQGRGLMSTSSADDDDPEENVLSSVTTLSNSTQPDGTKTFARSESLLSSSSPSASILTDETIKARISPTTTTGETLRYPPIRRSDTDLSQSLDSSSKHDLPCIGGSGQAEAGSSSFSRSESTYSQGNIHQITEAKRCSPDSRPSSSSQKLHCNSSNNFIQSVRAVKAQQHLLQNMIKHQNQNLLTSSSNRAKNAFMYPNRVHQSEYPFVTLRRYPENMIQCTGGVVSVHSVKLLDHIINDEESETRDIWWTEIRKEIRSHAKALNCNTILGYSETSKVLGDVCVLSASGTAAILNPVDSTTVAGSGGAGGGGKMGGEDRTGSPHSPNQQLQTLKVPRLGSSPPPTHSSMPNNQSSELDQNLQDLRQSSSYQQQQQQQQRLETNSIVDCSFCHTPLVCVESISSLANCTICQSSKVPDVLLLTIEPPQNLNIVSTGTLVQARVCRAKRDSHGEASAKEIGDALPFLEYELHRQLFVGENMLTGIATGTGCFVLGLPTPEPPQISAGKGIKASKLNEIQRLIALSAMKNRENIGLKQINAQLALYHEQINSTTGVKQGSPEPPMHQQQQQQQQQQQVPSGSNSPIPPTTTATSQDDNNTSGDSSGVGRSSVKLKTTSDASNYLRDHYNSLHSHHHHHHHHHHKHRHHNNNHHYHKSNKNYHPTPGDRANLLVPAENLTNLLSDDNNIVLEVDDNEDADIIALLIDSDTPDGYLICNSESIPTINQSSITSINMFTQVTRVKLTGMDQFAQQFDWILQALFVKLRRSLPCCLTNISFVVDLPESHIVQISVTGCLLGLNSIPGKANQSCALTSDDGSPRLTGSTSNTGLMQQSASTDSSMSPSSSSTSSSSSSSPSSSSATLPQSSSSLSSMKSAKETTAAAAVVVTASVAPTSEIPSASEPKSLRKQLSKSNLAALLSGKSVLSSVSGGGGGGGDKKKASKNDLEDIEMAQRQPKAGPSEETSTRDTIAAVKLEIEQNRLGNNQQLQLPVTAAAVVHPMRAVFKKQQTYPGASSPAISGHDKLLPASNNNNQGQLTIGGSGANNAARRATIILNKVKQPLKDLGSNFNSTTNSLVGGNHPSDAGGSPLIRHNGAGSAATGRNSVGKAIRAHQISGQQQQQQHSLSSATTSIATAAAPTTSIDQISHSLVPNDLYLGQKSGADRTINSSIDITSLSYIPGAKEYHYLGNLSLSFVRETNSVRENGGLNGFIHCFLMEVYAIVRAHVSALGGNAFLSFRLQQSCIFYHSNKNQAQCLISVAGDAVQVTL